MSIKTCWKLALVVCCVVGLAAVATAQDKSPPQKNLGKSLFQGIERILGMPKLPASNKTGNNRPQSTKDSVGGSTKTPSRTGTSAGRIQNRQLSSSSTRSRSRTARKRRQRWPRAAWYE